MNESDYLRSLYAGSVFVGVNGEIVFVSAPLFPATTSPQEVSGIHMAEQIVSCVGEQLELTAAMIAAPLAPAEAYVERR